MLQEMALLMVEWALIEFLMTFIGKKLESLSSYLVCRWRSHRPEAFPQKRLKRFLLGLALLCFALIIIDIFYGKRIEAGL